jgi:hypothetical protein
MSVGTITGGSLSPGFCDREAVEESGFTPEFVTLANAETEDEAASRWSDYASARGEWIARP